VNAGPIKGQGAPGAGPRKVSAATASFARMEIMDARDANAPGMLAIDELGARIVDLAGRLTAATCRWLLLVAEFDARDGCARAGVASTSQWLAYTCGIARRTAIEHVRVARSLAAQPRLAAEMGAGRLSYSQVRAISRIVEPGEQGLVEISSKRLATARSGNSKR
jgi:hypothetical protein